MKYFFGEALYKYSWDQVVAAFWQRYPNPQSKHVLSEDVLERKVVGRKLFSKRLICYFHFSKHVLSEDVLERKVVGRKLFSKRLICKTNSVPKWGEKIMSGLNRNVFVIEESVLDLNTKTFITYTRNVGLQKLMSVDEKCVYSKHPENRNWVSCLREAWVGSQITGLGGFVSSFGLQRFKKNAHNAISGFDHVLHKFYSGEMLQEPMTKKEKFKESAKKAKASAKKAKDLAKATAEKAKPKVPIVQASNSD